MDNIINISGFDDNGDAKDGNGNRIVIINNQTAHCLKEAVLQEPDKLVATITIIND